MNDADLDRLLDRWEAPVPSLSMRDDVRERFRSGDRQRFRPRLTWALVIAAATATLAIAVEQSAVNNWDFPAVHAFTGMYERFVQSIEGWRAGSIVNRIRGSEPKVYVDGQLAGRLEFGHAAQMEAHVPGEGVYAIITYPGLAGWMEAGRIHGRSIEFKAGSREVRIECNRQIVDSERPIFTRRK